MPSFDISSKVDAQTLDNAINVAKREILNRWDFKDSKSTVELNKKDKGRSAAVSAGARGHHARSHQDQYRHQHISPSHTCRRSGRPHCARAHTFHCVRRGLRPAQP